ncbi:MAG: cobaltochelatase subunit CobN, partial [Desulfuromonadales bacterium]|nr:cobaltochelatase subunit CobN [Desulfuromonadales bacterium]
HSQGKQNIAAAYMNVFRSLELILQRLQQEGYQVRDAEQLSEARLQELILAGGRNVGSWAPGELDALIASGQVEQVPLSEYRQWFAELPAAFRTPVLQQWGDPEQCAIMTKGGQMVFPMVKLGNLVLLPEPARGWSDDPMKLYHDTTLYPHHQYIAAYLWLQKRFHADAMIHLGTHATYEWLPGKQAGLSPSDPPEVMIGDIPNLYPYIVDDIGEGIEAKRRGRGVVIDYLTPPMRKADLYNEYAQLHALFHQYEYAHANGSETAGEYLAQIGELATTLGIDKDLGIAAVDEAAMEQIHLYLHEIEDNSLPYGLHTFGKHYDAAAEKETIALIMEQNPDAAPKQIEQDLHRSPPLEMDALLAGLNGAYIAPGEGNDPLRNLAALPTGRDFYGFSPAKVPSKAAWEVGKKAAEELIAAKIKEKGRYPEKVGVVLWATETTRNEGVNEATILYLMGMEPVWDQTERVRGSRVIPGKELGRPRIDVLINPSGLYRDMFPEKLLFLDEAVQRALLQTDVENLLAANSDKIKSALLQQGMSAEEAAKQSRFRIFTEEPGSYGNGVAEMAGSSGFWEDDEEISNVYLNRIQFAIGQGEWALPVKQAFSENLRHVDVAVHSRSSNVIGIIDTDDFFMYLGGMSLAVKNINGEAPSTMVTMHRRKDELMVEDVAKTIGREMRTRYLNPKWIEGMKKDNYAGARQMADFTENLWGWQVTVPQAVGADKWQQIYEVYVEDKYDQNLKEFFAEHSPWAYQSLTARVLETVRKGYWQPAEEITRKLATEYINNVLTHGVACCDHTCNNPALNQMVVNIASLPGVMSPELVEQFKIAIEKMAKKSLQQQVTERRQLQQQLTAGFERKQADAENRQVSESSEAQADAQEGAQNEDVTGYKMEEVTNEDKTTELTSSGVQWLASLSVIVLLVVVGGGIWWRRRRHD